MGNCCDREDDKNKIDVNAPSNYRNSYDGKGGKLVFRSYMRNGSTTDLEGGHENNFNSNNNSKILDERYYNIKYEYNCIITMKK